MIVRCGVCGFVARMSALLTMFVGTSPAAAVVVTAGGGAVSVGERSEPHAKAVMLRARHPAATATGRARDVTSSSP
jgi:hypothetical protein